MKLLQFLSSILPSHQKTTILTSFKNALDLLNEVIIPSYRSVSKIKLPSFDDDMKSVSSSIYKNIHIKGSKSSNIIADLYHLLDNYLSNVTYLANKAKVELPDQIFTTGLDGKKANLLRLAGTVTFINKYLTTLSVIAISTDTDSPSYKIDMKYLLSNASKFSYAFDGLSMDPKKFVTKYESIPDVIVNDHSKIALEATNADSYLDPFFDGWLLPLDINPIFFIRSKIADYQIACYRLDIEKKKMLELKLLHLENSRNDSPNPGLEREIEYLQSRIDKLARSILEVEEDAGVAK